METNNKLREALKDIGHLVEQIHFLYSDYPSEIHEIARKVNAAVAEPVKNCEVGTAREQAHRFHAFCMAHQSPIKVMCDPTCPCHEQPDKCHCMTVWAQMPYEAEEGGIR